MTTRLTREQTETHLTLLGWMPLMAPARAFSGSVSRSVGIGHTGGRTVMIYRGTHSGEPRCHPTRSDDWDEVDWAAITGSEFTKAVVLMRKEGWV